MLMSGLIEPIAGFYGSELWQEPNKSMTFKLTQGLFCMYCLLYVIYNIIYIIAMYVYKIIILYIFYVGFGKLNFSGINISYLTNYCHRSGASRSIRNQNKTSRVSSSKTGLHVTPTCQGASAFQTCPVASDVTFSFLFGAFQKDAYKFKCYYVIY